MHGFDGQTEDLAAAVLDYARNRLRMDPVPLDAPRSAAELAERAGRTVTPDGLGGRAALALFAEVLATACISTDHPRYLSFIPCAPTEAATLFDLVVGASSIYGGSWLEGAGAVHAENEALRWVADLAGLPPSAGGVFVPGASVGTLSALVAARQAARDRDARASGPRPADVGALRPARVLAGVEAHSSVRSATEVMDAELVAVPADERGRLTGAALAASVPDPRRHGVVAVVATAGSTNFGTVDDLASVAAYCRAHGLWLHVDAAYGGAALAAPSARGLFTGIERADSLVVDPHKWLFAPFDCAALVYRRPELARAAHTQRAGYLDVLTADEQANPSDLAIGLTRRARGLPFWFSLAAHGTRAYAAAVERTLAVARYAAEEIRRRPYVELLREPDLSVVVFRRLGWAPGRYREWSDRLLAANLAFVVPTVVDGETVTRFAVVNPRTSEADIATLLDTMA